MKNASIILVTAIAALGLQGCSGGMSLFGGGSARPAPAQQALLPATGAPPKGVADDSFAVFDSDSNGQVPKSEFEAGISAQFRNDDLNADGYLDSAETRAVNDRLMAEPGGSPVIDWNADGKVVVQEYASQWRTLFERADVNGDGLVDEEERAGRARVRKAPPLPQPELGRYRGKSSLVPDM